MVDGMTLDQLIQSSLNFIESNALALAVTAAAIFLLAFLARKKIKHIWINLKTRYCLNHLGHKCIANFKWPDGLGHYFIIDRLILHADGISLLMLTPYPGKIFCADGIDEWTQMIGQKSYRFANPLHELDFRIKAIAAATPNVNVDGYLFFDYQAEFPKGHPERVIYRDKIPEALQPDKQKQPDEALKASWDALLEKALS